MLGVTQPVGIRAETETKALSVPVCLSFFTSYCGKCPKKSLREQRFALVYCLGCRTPWCRSHCDKIWGSELSTSTVKTQRKKLHARLASPTLHRSGCPTQETAPPIIKTFLLISINVCPEAHLQGESRFCQGESKH